MYLLIKIFLLFAVNTEERFGAYMRIQERADTIRHVLQARYPDLKPHLHAANPWQWLVATVLSAQCTDARVNTVTPELFARWPDPVSLAKVPVEELEKVIRSTGFYHAKARHLIASAIRVCEVYGGVLPQDLENLMTMPGVARKTANVVLWEGFGINAGLAVDTHVKRIAFRIGLTEKRQPDAVEQDLLQIFPQEAWGHMNHRLVSFGRDVCHARKPLCDSCELYLYCQRYGL